RLQALHHRSRLLRVRARSDAQVVVGRGNPELLEKGGGHAVVVVLAGMHDHVLDAPLHQLAVDGRKLHEVRAGAHDGEDAHWVLSECAWRLGSPPEFPRGSRGSGTWTHCRAAAAR